MTMALTLDRTSRYFLRPLEIVRGYRLQDVRPDLVAGLTVAVVAIPQSIAYAFIAGLPASFGLYSACVASIVGSLWGSSRFLSTGPTNAASILVLSILAPLFAVGSREFLMAASVMAVIVGVFRLALGLAGFGMLVNFASRAVLVGFTAGAAVLIAAGQLPHLLRLDVHGTIRLRETVTAVAAKIHETHPASVAIGAGTILLILAINALCRGCPGSLIAMVGTGAIVAAIGVERLGVHTVGDIPRALPGVTELSFSWLFHQDVIGEMITGSLAVAALGLVEAMSIARSIARQSGERLDANQEFVGQGLANIATGVLSGYTCSGSFTRSAVNHQAGARTQMSGVFGGLLILAGVLAFGPYAAFLPRAALAGLLMLVAYRMVDRETIARVVKTSRNETTIMVATFLATLAFPLEFAVLSGVILSLAIYIYQSSMPSVHPVVPDETFRHFVEKPGAPPCPQLGVMNIRGSLFFGAASHVEDVLLHNLAANPGQNLLLLRMHGVDRCDLSGLEVLEGIVGTYRQRGGDVYMVQVRQPVRELMLQSGFDAWFGSENLLAQEEAIDTLFADVIDPAVCCYECEQRVFAECQALVKHHYDARLPAVTACSVDPARHLGVDEFEERLHRDGASALLLDVREPEEYRLGHLTGARLLPLRTIIDETTNLPHDATVFLVCRSGRRSTRAMHWLTDLGFADVYNLKGGILSWKACGRPIVVD